MNLVDTHCHIHEADFERGGSDPVRKIWLDGDKKAPDEMIKDAEQAGVTRLVCVGTTLADSKLAIEFVQSRTNCWASIGIHPHEAKDYVGGSNKLTDFALLATMPKVVAVGECGLDYFYNHSPKADQQKILRFQIELALANDLPLIFHVREAFDDFWPIFDSYKSGNRRIRGIIHSFSAGQEELDEILKRDLFVGLNGITTFVKDPAKLVVFKDLPLKKLVLETDAPFLTPTPYRGTINEPKYVRVTAEFLAKLRGESLETLASATTHNAVRLFGWEK